MPRGRDDQWYAGIEFVIRVFSPQLSFTDVQSVVGPKYDDSVVTYPLSVEFIQDLADLGIQVANRRQVTMSKFSHIVVGESFVVHSILKAGVRRSSVR